MGFSTDDIKKANALLESARRHAKKSLFKRPNWDEAASEYEDAAKIFTHAGDVDQASDSWTNACEAHKKAGNTSLAGRAIESRASLFEEMSQRCPEGGAKYLLCALETYREAFSYYGLNCMLDNQARALRKAMVFIRTTTAVTPFSRSALKNTFEEKRKDFVRRAISFLLEGVSILEKYADENPSFLVYLSEVYPVLILLHLRSGDVAGSVSMLERQLGVNAEHVHRKGVFERLSQPNKAAKAGLEIIVLCLSCGDDVWARQELEKIQNVYGFPGSNEETVAKLLVTSFEERDVELLQDTLKNQTLQFINAEISRIARKITLRFNPKGEVESVVGTLQQQHGQRDQQEQQVGGEQSPEIDEEEDIR